MTFRKQLFPFLFFFFLLIYIIASWWTVSFAVVLLAPTSGGPCKTDSHRQGRPGFHSQLFTCGCVDPVCPSEPSAEVNVWDGEVVADGAPKQSVCCQTPLFPKHAQTRHRLGIFLEDWKLKLEDWSPHFYLFYYIIIITSSSSSVFGHQWWDSFFVTGILESPCPCVRALYLRNYFTFCSQIVH